MVRCEVGDGGGEEGGEEGAGVEDRGAVAVGCEG